MDLQLRGKRVMITGGSKGIGLACAEVLAEEGCDLVLVARDVAALEATRTKLRARNAVDVQVIVADLSSDASARKIASEVGTVDILINNAGAIPPGNLHSVDDGAWRAGWDLKVFGFISLARAIYPAMAARGSGVILNIIGAAGERMDPAYIAGSSGNAALIAFTRALGRSSTADGIRVLGINPGSVETERLELLRRDWAHHKFGDAERWREAFQSLPFGRAAMPHEIAWSAAFLASPRSGYTSGVVLTIDGGV